MKQYIVIILLIFLWTIIPFSQQIENNQAKSTFSKAQIIMAKQANYPKEIIFKEGQYQPVASFFDIYRSAFNLSSDNEFKSFQVFTDHLGQTHHRYKQYYKGLEVAEVQYLLHEQDGLVHHAHGRLIHGLDLDIKPAISESSALQFALKHINAQQYAWENPAYKKMINSTYPKGKLMISTGNKEQLMENFRLVYRFEIFTAIPTGGYAVDVDANSGEIVGKHALVYQNDVQGKGQTLYNGIVPITVSDNNFPKPAFAHLNNWNAYGGNGQSWWFADPAVGNEGGYNNDWYQVLDTDPIDITGDNTVLKFYHRYSTEPFYENQTYGDYDGWDGMNVRISLDSGLTWQVLENPNPPYTGNNTFSFGAVHGEGKGIPAWSGSKNLWSQVALNLSSFIDKTIQIRFAFASDMGTSTADFLPANFGWQLDDVIISNSTDTLFSNYGTENGFTPKAVFQEYDGMNYRLWEFTRGGGVSTGKCILDEDYWVVQFSEIVDEDSLFNDTDDKAGVSAHWGAEATYDYFLSKFGRDSYDGNGSELNSYTDFYFHYSNGNISPNNAQWNGSFALYGKGDGTNYRPVVSLDVVGHEITHGVTMYSAGLIYQNEPGAINESFSDIFGTAVEFFKEGENADWLEAEDCKINGQLRSLKNPNSNFDPDTYKGQYWIKSVAEPTFDNDYGGVHTNSGVQNHWFYLLCEGGSGTNDKGDSYSVIGIGLEDAEQIAYRNLTVYLMPTSQFEDARLGAIHAAIDLFGLNSAQHQAVIDAWYAVGVSRPFVGPYAEECQLDDSYKQPVRDTLKIMSEIINPYNHHISVNAIVENVPRTRSDTVMLAIDSSHQASGSSLTTFRGIWPANEDEQMYQIHLNTISMDSGYNSFQPSMARFTTIGPVMPTQTAYIDTFYDHNSKTQVILPIMHNFGQMAAAKNLSIRINTGDTRVKEMDVGEQGFPNLDAGEVDTASIFNFLSFKYADGFIPDCTLTKPIGFNVKVLSDDVPYWTSSFDFTAEKLATDISVNPSPYPKKCTLFQNYPNPFNPKTVIQYQLSALSNVELNIYNILGQKVATLVSEKQPVGTHKIEWDATGFSSGVYLYRLSTDNGFVQNRKLVLLK